MSLINFKDYFWGKCDELHERYQIKQMAFLNINDFFTKLQLGLIEFSKILSSLAAKNYQFYPEKSASKYESLEYIKILLGLFLSQLNAAIEVIKNNILEMKKIKKEEDEQKKEKELYSDLKKNLVKYDDALSSLLKSKKKFYQSTKLAEMAIKQAKEFSMKQKEAEKTPEILDMGSKLEQKYLELLLEAKKNDEKYSETIKECNILRELVNEKQNKLLQFYEEVESNDDIIIKNLLKQCLSFVKTGNSMIKCNLLLMEDKINKINFDKDVISLINIYGSDKKPDKIIKYRPYKPDIDFENCVEENELTLNYHTIVTMKPYINHICPEFDIGKESKKQEIRELFTKIFSQNEPFSAEEMKIILENIEKDWGQKYFLFYLSKERTAGKFSLNENLLKQLSQFFQIILLNAERHLDYETAKSCIILSQTYYYENKGQKIYLVELISNNTWLRKPDFWRNIIEEMIKLDVKKYYEVSPESVNNKKEDESIKNIVFSQVISYINNMKDFHIDNKTIRKIIDEFVDKYKIGKNFSESLYANLGDNDKRDKNIINIEDEKE